MNLLDISRKIKDRKPSPLDIKKRYAVALTLIYVEEDLHVLYQVRSNLVTQPGEISFPGGKVELGESFEEAALRETCEELNIDRNSIEVLGQLDYFISPYSFELHPFVFLLKDIKKEDIKYNPQEVSSIFLVPLEFFIKTEPLLHYIELKTYIKDDFPFHMIHGGKDYDWRTGKYPVYFYEYENHIIWGMTARFTKNFIDIITKKKDKD